MAGQPGGEGAVQCSDSRRPGLQPLPPPAGSSPAAPWGPSLEPTVVLSDEAQEQVARVREGRVAGCHVPRKKGVCRLHVLQAGGRQAGGRAAAARRDFTAHESLSRAAVPS